MGMDGGNPAVPRQRCCHRVRPWQCHLPPSAPTHPELISLTAETLLLNATQAVTIKQTPKFRFGLFFFFVFSSSDGIEVPKAFPVFLLFDTAEQCTDFTLCICSMARAVSELQ